MSLIEPIGHCLCCGKPLWDPDAVRHGIGPICWDILARARAEHGVDDVYDLPFDDELRDLEFRRGDDGRHHFNFAQAIVRHSPTGMRWGYLGSGAADCALNALLAYAGDRQLALRHYHAFKFEFIAGLPEEGGRIDGAEVFDWLARQSPSLAF